MCVKRMKTQLDFRVQHDMKPLSGTGGNKIHASLFAYLIQTFTFKVSQVARGFLPPLSSSTESPFSKRSGHYFLEKKQKYNHTAFKPQSLF